MLNSTDYSLLFFHESIILIRFCWYIHRLIANRLMRFKILKLEAGFFASQQKSIFYASKTKHFK